jgi:hypothetical protein
VIPREGVESVHRKNGRTSAEKIDVIPREGVESQEVGDQRPHQRCVIPREGVERRKRGKELAEHLRAL